jgi:hypothetical protein
MTPLDNVRQASLAFCFFFLGLAQVRFTALDLGPIEVRNNHLSERFRTFSRKILKLRVRNSVVRGDEDRHHENKKPIKRGKTKVTETILCR